MAQRLARSSGREKRREEKRRERRREREKEGEGREKEGGKGRRRKGGGWIHVRERAPNKKKTPKQSTFSVFIYLCVTHGRYIHIYF